jgi:hypothetical protein
MAFVFHRELGLPLGALVFCTVALTTSPPATPFLMAVLGTAVIAFATRRMIPRAARVHTLEELRVSRAQETLDLVRMDDDGGWQKPHRSACQDHPAVNIRRSI